MNSVVACIECIGLPIFHHLVNRNVMYIANAPFASNAPDDASKSVYIRLVRAVTYRQSLSQCETKHVSE
jgi:hypothetical protein